ncbi:MAG: SMP-30/gluconolactonase/LRE family protein, partial [Bacteroidota bacterium]
MKILSVAFFLLISFTGFSQKSKIGTKNAEIEKAGTGYAFTEGPAVAPDGRVYFTDQPNDRIYV